MSVGALLAEMPPPRALTSEEMDRHISRLETQMAEIRSTISDLREISVEHRVRLENGTKVFSDWDKRIKAVEPKPGAWVRNAGLLLTILLTGLTALWALSEQLSSRPTARDVDKQFDAHERSGHAQLREEIRAIQLHQVEQRALIESIERQQERQNAKLDQRLERLPIRKPREAE